MRRALVAVLLFVGVLLVGVTLGSAGAVWAGSGPGQGDPPPTTVNEFFPADRPLGDCLSALPKPGCGSEERGGTRQTAVFAAMVLGLGVIGTRIVVGIRRRDRHGVSDHVSDPAQR